MSLQSNKIYWLAGILEGEATFSLKENKYTEIQLKMCDLDIIQRVRDIMNPSTNIRVRNVPDLKTQYVISIGGQIAAEWMMTIYVLMSNRRKEKIRECLQIWKARIGTKGENMTKTKRDNKMINLIMMSRKISREEAEKIFEDSLTSINQTIN